MTDIIGISLCRHVFETMGTKMCEICGSELNETDWDLVARTHHQWIADGKADWNICPEGGTIRGWWSI